MKQVCKVVVIMMIAGLPLLYWSNRASAFTGLWSESGDVSEDIAASSEMSRKSASLKVLDRWELPSMLREVSGIEYLGNARFACIQDELGTIFIYNTASGKIEKEIPFSGPGDFEGIALAGSTAYAVQSDGKIFEVQHYNEAKPVVKQYATSLTAKHNVEGFAYDKDNNRLLLAIKGEDPNSSTYKGVYAFDLRSKQLATAPIVKIDLTDPIFGEVKEKKRKNTFQPSEIEIHPVTKDLYILEGVNPKLLVMDAKGTKKKLYTMQRSDFPQAEGLAFTSNGDLFISNEGRDGVATIVRVTLE
jgi:uncharacterized protein YjiK